MITSDCDLNGMSIEPNLTDHDYELLSAYLDGELLDTERAELEARLEQDATLRRELNALRRTVALVSQLPVMKAPRDFTLDASAIQPAQMRVLPRQQIRRPFYRRASFMSAAAAVLLFIIGGVFVLSLLGPAVGNIYSNISSALNVGEPQRPAASGQVASAPTAQPTTALLTQLPDGPSPADTDQTAESQLLPATPTPFMFEGETEIAAEESETLSFAPPAAPLPTQEFREEDDLAAAGDDARATLNDATLSQAALMPTASEAGVDLFSAPQGTPAPGTGAAGSPPAIQATASAAEKLDPTRTQLAFETEMAAAGRTTLQQAQIPTEVPTSAEPAADEAPLLTEVPSQGRMQPEATATALAYALQQPTGTPEAAVSPTVQSQPDEQAESAPAQDNTLAILGIVIAVSLLAAGGWIIVQRRRSA